MWVTWGQIKRWVKVATVLGLILIGLLLWSRSSFHKKKDVSQALPTVQVIHSTAKQHGRVLTLQGHTKAHNAVTVRSETAGYVLSAPIEQGTVIPQNTLLIQLKPVDRAAHVKGAQAALEQKKLAYKASERLHSQGFRSKEALLLAQAERTVAEARLAEAFVKLSQLSVRAPFGGIFDKRLVTVGDYVKEGEALGTLVNLNPLKIAVAVGQDDRSKISVGQRGYVTIKEVGTVEGRVSYVSSSAALETRLFSLELETPNPDQKIVDGLVASVALEVGIVQAHQVPPSALSVLETGKIGVKVVDSTGTVQAYPVEVGASDAEATWVVGLPPQARVIIVGHEYVQTGKKVQAIENASHG